MRYASASQDRADTSAEIEAPRLAPGQADARQSGGRPGEHLVHRGHERDRPAVDSRPGQEGPGRPAHRRADHDQDPPSERRGRDATGGGTSRTRPPKPDDHADDRGRRGRSPVAARSTTTSSGTIATSSAAIPDATATPGPTRRAPRGRCRRRAAACRPARRRPTAGGSTRSAAKPRRTTRTRPAPRRRSGTGRRRTAAAAGSRRVSGWRGRWSPRRRRRWPAPPRSRLARFREVRPSGPTLR